MLAARYKLLPPRGNQPFTTVHAKMSVQTKLQYLKPLEQWNEIKPYQIIGRRPPGQPRENIELQSYNCSIVDVKSLDYSPSLDKEGFQWFRRKLVESLDSEASTKRHIQGIEIYLKDLFGAKGVVTYDYQVRKHLTLD